MRIAQVSPLYESVPPAQYGGTERIVSYLTEELIRLGHRVTLFASKDSKTDAHLIPLCDRALRLNPHVIDPIAHHVLLCERVSQIADDFDIIHFHTDYIHFPMVRRVSTPAVPTLHGRLDISDLEPLYKEFCDIPLVSISDNQRKPLPWVNWQGTVYHGLPENLYRFHEKPGKYLAFLGRICPEKGVDAAIEIAKRAGIELKIAAKVDRADRDYFKSVIKPLLKNPGVEFLGEIGEEEKNEFIGKAYALLFPIDWPEPFGLVMIESMACGTPIIARGRGSVPEIIQHGVTGFLIENIVEGAEAVKEISSLSRRRCREIFEERFTVTRMAENYLNIYRKLLLEKIRVRRPYEEALRRPGRAAHHG